MRKNVVKTIKRKLKSKTSLFIMGFILLSIISVPLFKYVLAETGDVNLKIETIVDNSEVYPGEEFTYTIKYRNADINAAAPNVVIKDILPDNIEFISSSPAAANDDIASIVVTEENGSSVVTITMQNITEDGTGAEVIKDELAAGASGIIQIGAKFPEGTTLPTDGENPTVAINTPTITSNGGNEAESNPVTVTPKFKDPDWSVTKTKTIPSIEPAVGQPVTYSIRVQGNSTIGGIDMENVVLKDTLPSGAQLVSSSNDGSYNSETGEVTWDIGDLKVGENKNVSITLIYPSETFTTLSNVTNIVDGSGNLISDPDTTLTVSDTAEHSFDVPTFGIGTFTKNSRQASDKYSNGQIAQFYLGGIENAGNISMDSFVIEDTVPTEITLTEITTGSYNYSAQVGIEYKTNLDVENWKIWTGSPFVNPTNQTLQVSDLGLADGEFLTNVKWVITGEGGATLPASFTNNSPIDVNGKIEATEGTMITNEATLTGNLSGEDPIILTDSETIEVIAPMPWMVVQKSVVGDSEVYENGEVKYKVVIKNHEFATGDLHNPIAIDVLPSALENPVYIDGETIINSDNDITVSDMAIFGNKLTWNMTGTLAPGDSVELYFTTNVIDGTTVGSYTNNAYLTTNTDTEFENTGDLIDDSSDLDGDSSSTDKLVTASDDIFVKFIGSLDAKKYVRGELDIVDGDSSAGWKLLDELGSTLPGGIVDYKLVVKNTDSNGPITNIVIIDKLPFVGDTGVLDNSDRASEWRPYLVNTITGENGAVLDSNITVYYSTEANPSLNELDDPTTSSNSGWSETLPSDITSVTAIKINFGSYVLGDGEEIAVEWPMRAPVDTPKEFVMWNSFAYGSTYTDVNGQEPFLSSEPEKVGFAVSEDPLGTYYLGDFVWEDMNKNGIQEDGEPGINGILVNLYDADTGDLLGYTRTGESYNGEDGYYDFPNLENGNYDVEFIFPNDYKITLNDVAEAGDDKDSDIDDESGYETTNYSDNGTDNSYVVRVSDVTINNANRLDIDAGLYKAAQVGNFVWNDYDRDGKQDNNSNETGINGVIVNLLKLNEAGDAYIQVATTTTANVDGKDGYYLFGDLDPGSYKVQVENPSDNYKFSKPDQGTDVNDSDTDDPAITTDTTGTISPTSTSDAFFLESGEYNPNLDFGMYLGQIGDLVWDDYDADGIKDSGEPGIDGLTVKLLDTLGNPAKDIDGNDIPSTTTANGGKYLFDELIPGNYIVEFDKGDYDKYSDQNSSGSPNSDEDHINTDSDADDSTPFDDIAQTGEINLAAGERDLYWDAGVYKFASLGDIVWNDLNANGIQDSVESGAAGVIVTLLDGNGDVVTTDGNGVAIAPVTTDGTGSYSFADLEPGDYKVRFTLPDDEYKFSDSGEGTTSTDSNVTDIVDLVGTTDTITLISGQYDDSIDAGIHRASLGDFVWDDLDADGIQDSGEKGVNGATVELYKTSDLGTPFMTTTTSTNPLTSKTGFYEFTDLESGDYMVKFIKPDDTYWVSPDNEGADDTKDSDGDKDTGWTEIITLDKGERDITWDYGIYIPAKLGDYVWDDLNGDGIQDVGESGINGATVKLFKGDVEIASTITADDGSGNAGYYKFIDLVPGEDYKVDFEMPAGYDKASSADSGSDDSKDSDAINAYYETADITLESGDDDTTVDFGVYEYSKIGDFVWLDSNMNGIQDSGELGLRYLTVKLFKKDGEDWNLADTTETNTSGIYEFDRLSPGEYYIEFTAKENHKFTLADNAGDDALDSDADVTTGKTSSFVIKSGDADNLTFDAGMYELASLGDLVWHDEDGDGIKDGTEVGIVGLTVELFDSSNNSQGTTTTDANGKYYFTDLEPGDYYVQFAKTDIYGVSPKGEGVNGALDSDADTITLKTDIVTLTTGENDMDIDMGLYLLSSIGDYVWEDTDGDGIQDGGEPLLSGVTVELYDSTKTLITSTTTGADGKYLFDKLEKGDYYIKFTKPTGYEITAKGDGSERLLDSNINDDGFTDLINLGYEQDIVEVDAGFYMPASLGDTVWLDKDKNAAQNGGEPGVAGILVSLVDENGDPVIDASDNPVGPTTTDGSGIYSFTNLVPGKYKVVFDIASLPHYEFTSKDLGGDEALDSDANLITGEATVVTLVSGENNLNIDAGLIVNTDINIEKTVYFGHDGGSQAGGELVIGENGALVTYVFKVTNTGDVNLNDVEIEDTDLGIDKSAMTLISGTEPLAPGATLTYYYESTIAGDLTNTANTTGTPVDNGGTQIPNVDKPTDSDTAAVDEVVVGIDVQKSVYFGIYNAASDEYETTSGKIGEWVTYIFKVTNNSDVYMKDIEINDDKLGITKDDMTYLSGNETLEPGGKLIYYYEAQIDGDLDNIVDTKGTPSDKDGNEYPQLTKPEDSDEAYVRALGSIGDYVWVDKNADKVQDADEVGIQGVVLELLDKDGNPILDDSSNPITATTDADGKYIFDRLEPGDYIVKIADTNPNLDGMTQDFELDSTLDGNVSVDLRAGDEVVNVDFGYYEVVSLGDYVWLDENEDGIQDSGEMAVQGIKVKLTDENGDVVSDVNGNTVDDTATDENGNYSFNNLIPGKYIVVFDLEDKSYYKFTGVGLAGDNTKDSDANIVTGAAPIVTLVSGDNNVTIDAGLTVKSEISIEKTVYNGHDGGKQVGEELVIGENGDNITYVFKVTNTGDTYLTNIEITDTDLSINKSDMTEISGDVSFIQTIINFFTGKGETLDIGEEPLAPGKSMLFYYETVYDGDLVNTAKVEGTATDENGVEIPNIEKPTAQDTAEVNEVKVAIDIQKSVYLGKYSVDSTGNEKVSGKNDEWVTYMFKVTNTSDVYMKDIEINDSILGITKDDMTYLSGNQTLAPGEELIYYYETQIDGDLDNIAETVGTPSDVGGNEYTELRKPTDSDDAIVRALGSIGDYVWVDKNADEVQDADEVGIEGVVLELLDKDGNPILDDSSNPITATTDVDGKYIFDRLKPGDYIVKIADTNPNLDGMTQDFELDSTLDGSVTVNLGVGEEISTVDFGYYEVVSLGDYVWLDENEDGIQDSGEMAVQGIKVKLTDENGDAVLDANGNAVEDTVTDASGNYSFTNLVPGKYIVVFDLEDKSHYKFTGVGLAGDNTKDSDANIVTGAAPIVTLVSGDNNITIDAGLTVKSEINIEKTVYNGHDGGEQIGDELAVGEHGMDVTYVFKVTNTGDTYLNNIEITDDDLSINRNDMTEISGDVSFIQAIIDFFTGKGSSIDIGEEPLAPGKSMLFYYETQFDGDLVNTAAVVGTPTDKDGFEVPNIDKPEDSDTAEVDEVQVGIDVQKSVYFGKYDVDSDENEETKGKNGEWVTYIFKVKNTSDTYLTNIEIKDSKLGIDKDDMTKLVAEEPLAPGSSLIYYYETKINGDLENIVEVVGTPSDKDGNVYENLTKPKDSDDANVKALGSIGDYVWIDYDGDKVQEEGEKGIPGVELSLLDKDSNPVLDADGKPMVVVTDEDGKYLFDRLDPGDYIVQITDNSAISEDLKQNFELDETLDGIVVLEIRPGEENLDVDFGYYTLGSIGDTVWRDANANGIQDKDEKGIENIVVNLYDENGELYEKTVTNEDGFYKFEKLPIGDYVVKFIVPEGYMLTEFMMGEDIEKDSDAYIDGKTATIVVGPETFNMTIDAGMYKINNITGVITDKDTGEPIEDAEVTLEDKDGNVVDTTTTDENGVYIFTAVLGEYYTIDIEKDGYDKITLEVDASEADVQVLSDIQTKSLLPKTGGKYFNYLLIGGILMIISATLIVRENKKKKRRSKRRHRRH
ncbi:SdrD B-like domain-containing protein [Clostridium sp. DL1XJH146]